jgi:hypothetical protein
VLLAVLLLAYGFDGKRDAIERVRADAAELRHERDSLLTEIRRRHQETVALTGRVIQYKGAAAMLRDSVTALERRRAANQLSVREIRTTGALVARMASTFPELGDSTWGLTSVPVEDGDTLGIAYLMLPAWFAETFIIDHANAESWRAQKHRLVAADSLGRLVTALQDSVTLLVTANATAYQAGYDAAYAGYQDLASRHVAELRKPRIRIPSVIGLLGAAGVGLVVGRALP